MSMCNALSVQGPLEYLYGTRVVTEIDRLICIESAYSREEPYNDLLLLSKT